MQTLTIFKWGWRRNNSIGLSNQMPWDSWECPVPAPSFLGVWHQHVIRGGKKVKWGTEKERHHHAFSGLQKWTSKIKTRKRQHMSPETYKTTRYLLPVHVNLDTDNMKNASRSGCTFLELIANEVWGELF